MLGDVFSGNPRFSAHVDGALEVRFEVVLNRLKSTIGMPFKHPVALEPSAVGEDCGWMRCNALNTIKLIAYWNSRRSGT
jgi:hypothetical protein